MSDGPNYTSYSLAELEDALRNIDRKLYPERVEIIGVEISKRLREQDKGPADSQPEQTYAPRPKRHWISGILVIIIGGVLFHFANLASESEALKETAAFEDALFFCPSKCRGQSSTRRLDRYRLPGIGLCEPGGGLEPWLAAPHERSGDAGNSR